MDHERSSINRESYPRSNYSGSGYRGSEQHEQSQHRGPNNSSLSEWSRSNSNSAKPHGERGMKRRYDQQGEHRKPYNEGAHNGGSPRKYFRPDSNPFYEGRSRSQHQPSHQHSVFEGNSSGRGQYRNNFGNNRGQKNHASSSYSSERRFDGHRSQTGDTGGRGFHKRGFSGSSSYHRGGGYVGNRGRGHGNNRNNSATHNKNYRGKRAEMSPSPSRKSVKEEESDNMVDDVSSKDKNQPTLMESKTEEETSSDKLIAFPSSESGQTARDEDDRAAMDEDAVEPVEGEEIRRTEEDDDDSSCRGSGTKREDKKKPEDDRFSKKASSKEIPEHFIRLQCPHCRQRSVTFRDYIAHLSTTRHTESLEKVSLQHRMSLSKLRTRQRQEQLQIEAQASRTPHNSRMNFCAICKLYHSESRPNHETTELHKIIKNFLMPYCPVCRVNFKSRMLYEKHVATLTHIKNKVNLEKTYERRRQQERSHSGEKGDELVLDLNSYMTLDAVGSVDGDGENSLRLEDASIGLECVKKVEVHFCEVCQRYLGRMEPIDKVIELHCRTRAHHSAFEEQQNGHKNEDQAEAKSELQGSAESEIKRSDSQERLWVEAEKDIGELCDLIGSEDGQALEEDDKNSSSSGEENAGHCV